MEAIVTHDEMEAGDRLADPKLKPSAEPRSTASLKAVRVRTALQSPWLQAACGRKSSEFISQREARFGVRDVPVALSIAFGGQQPKGKFLSRLIPAVREGGADLKLESPDPRDLASRVKKFSRLPTAPAHIRPPQPCAAGESVQ